jgi:hypothetical protein
MKEDYVDCLELTGKTIQRFRIHKDTGDGPELQIDLTDGTSFSYSVSSQTSTRATLYKGGVGTPEILCHSTI